jgi:hypothetical protein
VVAQAHPTFPFRDLTVDAVWSKADLHNMLCGINIEPEIREPESVLARHLYVLGGTRPRKTLKHAIQFIDMRQ